MAMLHRNASRWRSAAPCGPKKWAAWDERSEDGLACENIAIWMMENPTTGGGEVGMGGDMTTAQLTRTVKGSLPGATGAPLRRLFAIPSYGLYYTAAQSAFIRSSAAFTHIVKAQLVAGAIDGAYFIYRASSYAAYGWSGPFVFCAGSSSATLKTANMITTQPVYIAFWSDGTTFRAGWSTVKPTKLSDFTSVVTSPRTVAYIQSQNFYFNGLACDTDQSGSAYIYYEMMSNLCLIDNNA